MSETSYSKKNDRIECVRYKEWRKSYPPHTLHEIKTVGDECYSMVVLCTALEPDEIVAEDCARLDELQKSILENPENIYLIEQMA